MKRIAVSFQICALATSILAAATAIAGPSNPAINFTLTHGEPATGPSYDWVEYGNGEFLAWSNADATMSTSTDGISWSHTPTGQAEGIAVTQAVHGGGIWFTYWEQQGGSDTSVNEEWRYLNANEWKVVTEFSIIDLAYGNGYWMAMGDDGHLWRSANVETWEQVGDWESLINAAQIEFPNQGPLVPVRPGITFAGSDFYLGAVISSSDGTSWTISDTFPAAPPRLNGPYPGEFNPKFHGLTGGPYVSSSAISDGEEWHLLERLSATPPPDTSRRVEDYSYSAGLAAALTTNGELHVSQDGALHVIRTASTARRIAASDEEVRVISPEGEIHIYRDQEKAEHFLRTPSPLADIAFGDGRWVIVGENGFIATADATTPNWQIPHALRHVAYYEGIFLAMSSDIALISNDGVSWQVTDLPDLDGINRLEVSGGFILFEENSTRSALSQDGITWIIQDSVLQSPIADFEVLTHLRRPIDVSTGNNTAAITGFYYYGTAAPRWPTWHYTIGAALIGFDGEGTSHLNDFSISPQQGDHYFRDGYLISTAYGAGRHLIVGEGAVSFWTESFADYGPAQFLGAEEAESIGRPMLYDVAFGNRRFVAVGAGNAIYTSEVTEIDDPLWGNLWDAGEGWYQHADLGWIYPMEDNWAWHLSLGWVLADPAAGGAFPYIDGIGWAWTSADLLPWIYTYDDGNWWTVDLYSRVPNLVFWGYDETIQDWFYQLQQDF